MATLEDRIAEATQKITDLTKKAATLKKNANDWRTSLNVCNQISNSKKQACEQDNQYRLGMAKTREDSAKATEKELEEVTLMRQQLLDLLEDKSKSESLATINLSNQGLSLEGLRLEAEGQAEAVKLKAELEGQASLKSATEASKSQKYVFIAIAVVIVIVGGIFAWTKFKK